MDIMMTVMMDCEHDSSGDGVNKVVLVMKDCEHGNYDDAL